MAMDAPGALVARISSVMAFSRLESSNSWASAGCDDATSAAAQHIHESDLTSSRPVGRGG